VDDVVERRHQHPGVVDVERDGSLGEVVVAAGAGGDE
jgi:hypothetical protein